MLRAHRGVKRARAAFIAKDRSFSNTRLRPDTIEYEPKCTQDLLGTLAVRAEIELRRASIIRAALASATLRANISVSTILRLGTGS
jgi:hypothetical protein